MRCFKYNRAARFVPLILKFSGDRTDAGCIAVVRASRRAFLALLSMRYTFDGIKKTLLILRKPRSGCLEGRTVLIPAA
jgi:hypothetical protein